jgi:hypothetical protein
MVEHYFYSKNSKPPLALRASESSENVMFLVKLEFKMSPKCTVIQVQSLKVMSS